MSNQGQKIPKQLSLLIDTGARVLDRPYRFVRAEKHFAHPNEPDMTLCYAPVGNMRRLSRPLQLGDVAKVATCKACRQHAERMESVLRAELSTWVDTLTEYQHGASNTPCNEGEE